MRNEDLQRLWRQRNKLSRKAYAADHYANNKEQYAERWKKYYAANKYRLNKIRADRVQAKRDKNKEKVKEYISSLAESDQLRLLKEHWEAPGARDFNEPMVVHLLREAGYEVMYQKSPLPDLLVSHLPRVFYVEVKMKGKELSQHQLESFNELDFPVYIARDMKDVSVIVEGEDILKQQEMFDED